MPNMVQALKALLDVDDPTHTPCLEQPEGHQKYIPLLFQSPLRSEQFNDLGVVLLPET